MEDIVESLSVRESFVPVGTVLIRFLVPFGGIMIKMKPVTAESDEVEVTHEVHRIVEGITGGTVEILLNLFMKIAQQVSGEPEVVDVPIYHVAALVNQTKTLSNHTSVSGS